MALKKKKDKVKLPQQEDPPEELTPIAIPTVTVTGICGPEDELRVVTAILGPSEI